MAAGPLIIDHQSSRPAWDEMREREAEQPRSKNIILLTNPPLSAPWQALAGGENVFKSTSHITPLSCMTPGDGFGWDGFLNGKSLLVLLGVFPVELSVCVLNVVNSGHT